MGVVIVGAGLAGIACAAELAGSGVAVRVLERGPSLGGRMASPPIEGRPVDLGAAYFTVRDPEFAAVVERWQAAGLARPWTDELAVLGDGTRGTAPGPMRWAAPDGLGSLVAALATGLEVVLDREVGRVGPGPVADVRGAQARRADAVVLAMPDPQAARVLDAAAPAAELVAGRDWRPVVAVAAGWPQRCWDALRAAFVNDHPVLSFVADDGDRRGDGAPVLVAHTTAETAREHAADPAGAVVPVLGALRELLGIDAPPAWTHARYWPCASPARDREELFHLGEDGIGLAGDGWGSARVETAWRSGTLLGRELARRLGPG